MPEIGRIQSTTFQSLLTELGITRNNIPFALRSEVTPVVLVGGTVSFIAPPTPAYRVTDVFTVGEVVAPVAGTILADTGPLPIGTYGLQVDVLHAEATTIRSDFAFEWRNAANSANLVALRWEFEATQLNTFLIRLNVENDNERFRLLNVTAGNVGVVYQGTIFART